MLAGKSNDLFDIQEANDGAKYTRAVLESRGKQGS